MKSAGAKKNSTGDVVRARTKIELDSLLSMRDDGSNYIPWADALDAYFQMNYGLIGCFVNEPTGYYKRDAWTPDKFAELQALVGYTDNEMRKVRRSKIDDFLKQRDQDIEDYSKMYGVIMNTLSLNSRRLLKEDAAYPACAERRKPLELIKLIKHTIVTQSIGKTADAQADVLIRRWHLLKCGERELAEDFCARAEQLWDALTAAKHPEKPQLPAAIRYVTRLLVNNPKYAPYVTDVLNLAQRPATAGEAFATTFASIPTAARNFFSPVATSSRFSHGPFAYDTQQSCPGCGSYYHTAEKCYTLHPELRPGHDSKPAADSVKPAAGESDANVSKQRKKSKKPFHQRKGKQTGPRPVTAYATLTEAMAFGLEM